jgi:hypothetical protein
LHNARIPVVIEESKKMIKTKINNVFLKIIGVLVSVSLVTYLLVPINFASGVGYATWRNIGMSNSNIGQAMTTTSSAITSTSQTTVNVTSTAGFPPPPFVVTIGSTASEAIEVTAVSGNTWTIVRGFDGTTALASITSGSNISGATSYYVHFVPATPATSIQAIVLDFCSDSPIYNSTTCTQPTGMQIGPTGANKTAIGSTSIGGISSSLFTTNAVVYTNRDDIILSNSGTGYVPQTPTTIPGTITTGTTSITVSSATGYPVASTNNPASWYYLSISGTETVQVTNTSGTTFTITRAQLGTVATSGTGLSLSQPPITFVVYGVTNPTSTGALYARIYTFSTYATASTFASTAPLTGTTYSTASGAVIDAGGVALYITNTLTVSAKVQEYLQFCVYASTTATAAPCSLTGSTVTLGNAGGILSISNAYVDSSTRFDIATNASGYAAVTFTGLPLSNGSLLIENSGASGTGSVAATAYTSAVGTDQFGLCSIAAAAGNQATNYTSTNLSFPNATYNSGTCPTALLASSSYAGGASFGLNIAQAGSVYGDLLAIQKPGTGSTGLISFIGNVAASQLAGIYTTTFNFVASGTY